MKAGRPEDALAWVPYLTRKGAYTLAHMAQHHDDPAVLKAALARLVPYATRRESALWYQLMLVSTQKGQMGCVDALLTCSASEDALRVNMEERLSVCFIATVMLDHAAVANRMLQAMSWDLIARRVIQIEAWPQADEIAKLLSPPQSWQDEVLAHAPSLPCRTSAHPSRA